MIYLASPFSHPDPAIEHERYRAVREYTAIRLRDFNEPIFSPIVYGYPFHKHHHMGSDAATWIKLNTVMIKASASVRVLMLSGWEKSVGVTAEIDLAKALFIPVEFIGAPDA